MGIVLINIGLLVVVFIVNLAAIDMQQDTVIVMDFHIQLLHTTQLATIQLKASIINHLGVINF